MNKKKFIQKLLELKPSGWDPYVETHRDTNEGLKYGSWKKYEGQKHIDERNVFPNELVFDIDGLNLEESRKEVRKITQYLDKKNIPYFVADTGGSSFHIHVFFKLPVDSWKEYNPGRKALYRLIKEELKDQGIKTDYLDENPVFFDEIEGKGHLIRSIGGRKTETGQRKTLVSEDLEKKEIEDKGKVKYPEYLDKLNITKTGYVGSEFKLEDIEQKAKEIYEEEEETRKEDYNETYETEKNGLQALRNIPADKVLRALGEYEDKAEKDSFVTCPCHNDTNPSLKIVGPKTVKKSKKLNEEFIGSAKCFGDCSEWKNAIDLVMGVKDCEFKEARDWLADKFDIGLRNKADSSDDPVKPDSDKNPLDRDNLPFVISHLLGYKYVDRGLRLQGEEYLPVKKATWYQTHSMVMRKKRVELGDIITDLRFHNVFPMPSGSGKKNVIIFLDKLFREKRGEEVTKPTSLHPEQLIGKTIRRGKKNPEYEEIRGHLDDDLVIIDEGIDLFRSSKEKISNTRSYLNEALDYYGQNRVTKRMTDIPKENRLSYMPDANLTIFMQPFRVDEEFALQGTLRRFLIPYSDFPPQAQIEGYEKRVKGNKDMELATAISELDKQLESIMLNDSTEDWLSVEGGAKDRFLELHRNLVFQGFAHSDKGKNFTRIIDYQLQDTLLKFAGIQAIVNGNEKITEEDIEKAYIDLSDILSCMLDYVYKKIVGNLDYGDDWKGARKEDRKCLKWLKEKRATSKDKSNIKVPEYVAKIKDICNVQERQARRKISTHEENGWVSRKQIGQHDSRVWLEIDTEGGQGGQGGHGVKAIREKIRENSPYFDLVKKYQNDEDGQGGQGGHGVNKKNRDKPGDNPDNPDNPEVADERGVEEITEENVLNKIEELDDGEGVPYSDLTEIFEDNSKFEELIDDFLSDGTCFEPRAGRIKKL